MKFIKRYELICNSPSYIQITRTNKIVENSRRNVQKTINKSWKLSYVADYLHICNTKLFFLRWRSVQNKMSLTFLSTYFCLKKKRFWVKCQTFEIFSKLFEKNVHDLFKTFQDFQNVRDFSQFSNILRFCFQKCSRFLFLDLFSKNVRDFHIFSS